MTARTYSTFDSQLARGRRRHWSAPWLPLRLGCDGWSRSRGGRRSLQGGLLVVDAAGDGLAGLEEDGDEHVVSAEGEVVAFHRVHARAGE